ncbi:hypothetical protein K402DRAFT_391465 [Aulographum hederae CBS 113979]|uniref:Transcription factor domain-containing protein n=1 Tax=Aulographum hederae CBS 113979 TaxID=1176131 RepID=A0A6G1H6S5_9PEZI|nr:hypothetical protein K402DRAFT_391465 [Aulographum hederae CBS 113979]
MCADENSSFELDIGCLKLLDRFHRQTIHQLGNPKFITIFGNHIAQLAFTNPFLMHVILAITATHSRYLAQHPIPLPRTIPELHHWVCCAALFNQKLSQPIRPDDRDPLWATAAFLGIIAMSSFDISDPAKAFPLKESEPSDLEWLMFAEGKMAVFDLVKPLREGSVFVEMEQEYSQAMTPASGSGIEGVVPELAEICELTASSSAASSPYFHAVHSLSLLQTKAAQGAMTKAMTLNFLGKMDPEYKKLLHVKDDRALLLLAMWYKMAMGHQWWVEHRATVEGAAICEYLRRRCGGDELMLRLLPWPSGVQTLA